MPQQTTAENQREPYENFQIIEQQLFDCWDQPIKVLKALGKGGQGEVYLMQAQDDEGKCALKVYQGYATQAERETEMMMMLEQKFKEAAKEDCQNYPFVKLFEMRNINEQQYFLKMEYCTNGDLCELVKQHGALPKEIANNIFMQIINAVQFMHSDCKVAHLDLKPDNILLTNDFDIKICDFGYSQSLQGNIYNDYGTPGYKAPEISSKQRLYYGYSGETADIFSLGVTLFILHFGVPPFMKSNSQLDQHYKLIQDYKRAGDKTKAINRFLQYHISTKTLVILNQDDVDLIDLMMNMLQENPIDRIQNIQGIKDHKYFNKEESNNIKSPHCDKQILAAQIKKHISKSI